MVNVEPHIEVYDVKKMKKVSYGNAGKIALIGAFPTSTGKAIDLYTDYNDARDKLKGEYKTKDDNSVENISKTVVPETYIAFYCLDYIFYNNIDNAGNESVLIVNTNYGKSTLTTEASNEDIANACLLLEEEDFDILTLAQNTKLVISNNLNPIWSTLKSFEKKMYKNQSPFGIITGIDLTGAVESNLESFKALWADRGIYKAVCTPIRINGDAEALDIAKSGCWHSNYTAGRTVNKSETGKIYEDLIGENTKELYPNTATLTWKKLLDNGFFTTKYRNRRLMTLQCLSNITPNDRDMKIERVKNYMIKRLLLNDYLGDDNDRVTIGMIKGKFEFEKQLAIKNNYLVDMEYNFEPVVKDTDETDTLKVNLKLYIADVLRVIKLYVTVEISAYEEI